MRKFRILKNPQELNWHMSRAAIRPIMLIFRGDMDYIVHLKIPNYALNYDFSFEWCLQRVILDQSKFSFRVGKVKEMSVIDVQRKARSLFSEFRKLERKERIYNNIVFLRAV